ncbi:MAG: hypothetical protein ACTSR2_11705, partial [Candidatus Hodarchaeales archaeon]
MGNYDSNETLPTQFFLAHIVFDEEHGPVLKSYLSHELNIPKIILQGVTTTLFTMAIGVGEPTGEPDTAIIPINVTGIKGRVLIHSFAIEDPKARGKNRIESFMLFIPRSHQDKLLQHSLTFSNILQEAITAIKVKHNGSTEEYSLKEIFNNIKKVLLTEIDSSIQNIISEICTEKETVIVCDGTIRAVHNLVLSPQVISIVHQIHSLIVGYEEELKRSGTFFDALPIEIHGKTYSDHQFYLVAIENNFIIAFSSGKGRLGSLYRMFREILWEMNVKNAFKPKIRISRYKTLIEDSTNLFPDNKFIDASFELLRRYTPIITNVSLIRCSRNRVDVIRSSDFDATKKHAFICQLFQEINQLISRLFRSSLIQIVLSQHNLNTIALMWVMNSKGDTSLYMVGDSTKGVGLLKLVSEQILEY